MGAQNFNFALNLPTMGNLQPQIWYFWKKNFQQAKIWGEGRGNCPWYPLPWHQCQ